MQFSWFMKIILVLNCSIYFQIVGIKFLVFGFMGKGYKIFNLEDILKRDGYNGYMV